MNKVIPKMICNAILEAMMLILLRASVKPINVGDLSFRRLQHSRIDNRPSAPFGCKERT